jgi:dimethylglycine dehydrogenase
VACLPPAEGAAQGGLGTVTGGSTGNTSHLESFMVFGSGVAERYYERWFETQQVAFGAENGAADVTFRTLGFEMCGLSIAGPNARALLERLTDDDVSAENFGFMRFRRLDLGSVPVLCGKVTFSGDLGYEFWMPASYQRTVFDALMEAGAELGIRLFAGQALDSLRLEKSFGSWAREYRPLYTPFEAGLDRFVKLDAAKKGDFIGRNALVEKAAAGPDKLLVTFTVDVGGGADAADVIGDEPVWFTASGGDGPDGGAVVGWVTSGGYAHGSEASVALAYVPAALVETDGSFEIEVLGVRRWAKLQREPLFDPAGERMRS